MTWLQFIASIVGSLSWPAVVLGAIMLLRKPLGDVVRGLRGVQYKDLKLEFGKKLEEAERKAKYLQLLPPVAVSEELDETKPDLPARVADLARISPRAAVAEAWRELEIEIRGAIESRGESAPRAPKRLIEAAIDKQIIAPASGSLFDDLRNMRNAAVHAPDYALDPEQAVEYGDVTAQLIQGVRKAKGQWLPSTGDRRAS